MRSILQFFVPNNEQFYELLEAQADNGVACASAFKELAERFSLLSAPERKKRIQDLKDLERKGDRIRHDLVKKLQTSFVTPIDRDFLFQLAALMEDQTDLFYDAARKIREFQVARLPRYYPKQAALALETVAAVQQAVHRLRAMEEVDALHEQVHDLEEAADRLYSRAMHELFSDSLRAIDILRDKELYEELENAINKSKQIMELVQGIVISHA